MSARALAACFGALALLATAAAAQDVDAPPAVEGDFVRVVGERFQVGGAPFRFVGANVAVMHGPAHRASLGAVLDAVQADGLSVVRVWALGERDALAPEWARSYAFRFGEEGWVEESFAHLDLVLAEARARGLRVIVVLANRWGDYGGIPQYLHWSGDPFDASTPDGIARVQLGTFFHSERARVSYLAHVDHVIGRVSTVTGTAYRDDPTILAWELVNEISAERRDAPALAAFVSEIARHVHALDPSHLVSAGHIGYETAAERRTWREIVSLPEIDFADTHAYPTEYDRVRSARELDAWIDDRAMLAHAVAHKPLVVGEVGFREDRRPFGRTRPQLFDRFLSRAERDGVDGVLPWIYTASADRPSTHGILVDGRDPSSRRVRAVLARRARSFATSTTSPPWPEGDAALWDPSYDVVGTRAVARPDAHGVVTIAPDRFAAARFETVGTYDEGAVAHVYGGGHGWVTYRFRAPRALGARIAISMRASSELPGRGIGATPDDVSHVVAQIDGHPIGGFDVPPDDAIGRRVSFDVPIDDALRAVLVARSVHTLRLEVVDDDTAHGLCLYGAATGREPMDPAIAAELPGRLELAFLP